MCHTEILLNAKITRQPSLLFSISCIILTGVILQVRHGALLQAPLEADSLIKDE
jgi:hypothetical protein